MIATQHQPSVHSHLTGAESDCPSPLTGEGWYRRCICAVLVCLQAATEAEIAERCRRFYRIDPLDTSEQLRLLAEVGVVRGVKMTTGAVARSDDAGTHADDAEQLWELA